MAQARISPGGIRELGWINTAVARLAGRVTGTGPLNIFTTLGRRRGLFRAWLVYSGAMMPCGRLPRQDTELVILRVAYLRECEYEWRHHERIGRKVGLSADQIGDIRREDMTSWEPRRRAIIEACTQLVRCRDIDDRAWSVLDRHLDDAQIIELLMLCGHYDALATALLTLRVQPERS